MSSNSDSTMGADSGSSKFDGTLLQLIGWSLFAVLVTVFTLGILLPVGVVNLWRWEINHTVIEGRRLHFEGTAMGLFALWIRWWLLGLVTLGIYYLWVPISLRRWKTRNTHFA